MLTLRVILPIQGSFDAVSHGQTNHGALVGDWLLFQGIGALNPSTIRRFVFTLITGYLAIYGVRQIPYEFPNEWGVIIPVLIVVYIITVWLDGLIFNDVTAVGPSDRVAETPTKTKPKKRATGFGD